MLEFRGQFKDLQLNPFTNKWSITFETQDDLRQCIDDLQEKELVVKVTQYKKGRSLNANNYAWVLIRKLAQKANIEPLEIYRKYILEVGIFKQFEINEKAVDTFIKSWEMHGYGWICQKIDYAEHEGFVLLNAYYGSSTYNTQQMSRLIDNLVNDCKLQGIQVISDGELDLLKSDWSNK